MGIWVGWLRVLAARVNHATFTTIVWGLCYCSRTVTSPPTSHKEMTYEWQQSREACARATDHVQRTQSNQRPTFTPMSNGYLLQDRFIQHFSGRDTTSISSNTMAQGQSRVLFPSCMDSRGLDQIPTRGRYRAKILHWPTIENLTICWMVGTRLFFALGGIIAYFLYIFSWSFPCLQKFCVINVAKVSFLKGDHKNDGSLTDSPFLWSPFRKETLATVNQHYF